MDNNKLQNLENAVRELIEAENNLPKELCIACFIAEIRGSKYCQVHADVGFKYDDAERKVLQAARELFEN